MGLTTRPSKKFDLTKIDEIQDEFFENKTTENIKENKAETGLVNKNEGELLIFESDLPNFENLTKSESKSKINNRTKLNKQSQKGSIEVEEIDRDNLKIADLLAISKTAGVRHTSRPYTVPRSLTIDLNRLKSKFRNRSLQYTQNELMDKMLNESLEIVSSENFIELREKAFGFVKSAEQCSRRSVTLTEETVSEMNELKADLALKYNRRFSADEIFTTLLAVAFLPLYENKLL